MITDLNMPIMDGYSLTKVLREKIKQGIISNMIIVASPALGQDDNTASLKNEGFDEVVTKPLDRKRLQTLVKQLEKSIRN